MGMGARADTDVTLPLSLSTSPLPIDIAHDSLSQQWRSDYALVAFRELGLV